MDIFKKLMIGNKGLRYKLMLAFCLMSIIPLLASMYIISSYVFPKSQDIIDISAIVMASLIIALLGLLLAKRLIVPVIDMAIEARIIASGEYDRKIDISGDDEIGNLALSINSMTQRIKSNLDELKSYGQRMKDLNVEIHKKVLGLSSLLQIGDIISTGSVELGPLLELAVEKSAAVFDGGYGALYMPREEGGNFISSFTYNMVKEKLTDIVIAKDGDGILGRALSTHSSIVIDSSVKPTKEIEELKQSYNLLNILAIPICSGRKNLAMLLVGNRLDDFKFKNDDIELIRVFAKQITIAIESDILSKKTEELAIKDDLTDLYNKNFISTRLEEEIKRSIFYQRPCSFIIFSIDDFKAFREAHGELVAEEALKKMAKLIKDSSGPIGKAARISVDEFAILLPEKNKKEAASIAEELRKKIEVANLLREAKAMLTVSCGVSENPIDGATGDELYKKALDAVRDAKMSGRNRVVA